MTDVIDTEAEVVSETAEPGSRPPPTGSEVHAYSVAATIEWLRRPETEQWAAEIDAKTKRFAHKVEEEFAPTFRMMRDIAVDDTERKSLLDGFLRSITGIED